MTVAVVDRRRRCFSVWFVAAALASSVTACAERQPEDAAADVLRVIEAYDRAVGEKDSLRLTEIMSPRFVYFTSSGAVRDRDRFVAFLVSPAYRPTHRRRDELVPIVQGGTAVVSSRWSGSGTYRGQPFEDDQRCSLVLSQTEDAWKLLAEHCTPIIE